MKTDHVENRLWVRGREGNLHFEFLPSIYKLGSFVNKYSKEQF